MAYRGACARVALAASRDRSRLIDEDDTVSCDVSVEEMGGAYRLRAHRSLGRAFLLTFGAPLVDDALPSELIVDELPWDLPELVTVWRLVKGEN